MVDEIERRRFRMVQASSLLAMLYLRRSILRPRTLLLIALLAINGVFAFLSSDSGDPGGFESHMTDILFGFLLPAMCLVLGVGVIRDEVESGTIGYLLLRPVSRSTMYLSHLAVACCVTAAFAVASTTCTMFILAVPASVEPGRVLLVSAVGSIAFTCLFAAFGTLLNRPFLIGVGWLIGVERLVATASFQGRYGAISAHLQSLSGLQYSPENGLVSRLVEPVSTFGSVGYLIVFTVLAVLVGLTAFKRREFGGDAPTE